MTQFATDISYLSSSKKGSKSPVATATSTPAVKVPPLKVPADKKEYEEKYYLVTNEPADFDNNRECFTSFNANRHVSPDTRFFDPYDVNVSKSHTLL